MSVQYSDNDARKYPVSVKGVIIIDGKVPILKNERNEFELPGGKLEVNEQPIECVVREIKEELNIDVKVTDIIDSWLYKITKNIQVVIITYGCILISKQHNLQISSEHKGILMADSDSIKVINMPENYKLSIQKWFSKCHAGFNIA